MQNQNVTLEQIADGVGIPAAPGATPAPEPDAAPTPPEVGEDEETQAKLGRRLYALEEMLGESVNV